MGTCKWLVCWDGRNHVALEQSSTKLVLVFAKRRDTYPSWCWCLVCLEVGDACGWRQKKGETAEEGGCRNTGDKGCDSE